MGRYVPPDLEGVASFNQASGKKARNLTSTGGQTVRFEMPYAIWCTTCPKETIIGQGVRFNAEKTKIGHYFSTPIFSFKLKHIACGGLIEIQTDPKNTAYVIVAGAKKRDTGEDRLRDGEVIIAGKSEEDKKRLEADPFARLEEKVADKTQAQTEKTRIQELYTQNSRDWSDPGEANRRLRKTFRVGRKVRNQKAEATEALQERIGFGGEILEENEGDVRRAQLVEFGAGPNAIDAASKPLFDTLLPARKLDTSAKAVEKQKEALSRDLRSNTRMAMDPFLNIDRSHQNASDVSALLKRKRDRETEVVSLGVKELAHSNKPRSPRAAPLVDYDSD